MGPRLGRALGREPAARAGARHRLRADRPVRAPSRLRHARRGDERLRRSERRAGRAAAAAAARARRRRRGTGDRVRRPRGAAGAGADRASARSSTRRSSSRCWRCSGRSSPRTTCSASCSRGRATGRATTLRATSTAPPTTRGLRSRPAPTRWRRASSGSSAGPTSSSSRGSRPAPGACSTSRRSTRRLRAGSASATATRCSRPSRRPRRRSRRSTTRATSSPIPSWPRSARSRTSQGIKMPNVIARLSATPGEIRRAGGRHGEDTEAVLEELGVGATSSSGCARTGSSERPAAHLALRPRRPPRPGREGDRLGGARGDRRPRGRRRARREGRGAGRTSRRCSAPAREACLRSRQRRRRGRPRGRRGAGRSSGVVVPKVARPEDVPGDRPAGALPDRVGRGPRSRLRDRERAGRRRDLPRRVRPPLGDRRARGGARLGARQDRQRRRRRRPAAAAAVRLPPRCATTRGSPARARAAASSATSAALRSIPAQLPIIEQAYLPTEDEVERARATVERLEAAGAGTLEAGAVRRRRDARRGAADRGPGRLRTAPQHVQHQGGTHEEPAHTGPLTHWRAAQRCC